VDRARPRAAAAADRALIAVESNLKPSDPIVSVELMGGLGNQMFQYAAGHALARRTGAALRLDLGHFAQAGKRRYLLDCFAVPAHVSQEPSPIAWRGLAHWLALRACRRLGVSTKFLLDGWTVYDQPAVHFDPAFAALAPPVHLKGYFQSERYFRDVADEIRKLFTIRIAASPSFAARRDEIATADWPVSIHVRRGDYVSDPATHEIHGTCDEAYYRRAIALAERLAAKPPTWFVFSDDVARAREALAGLQNAVYVDGDDARPWEDLALMAACRGHIIANSSFSWWGAWLDPRPDKWVIAPRQWFAPAHARTVSTADIFCPEWISL
jgi:hypothetical protein